MTENEKYPGCPPGWYPDLVLATRLFDSQSEEGQVANARKRWAIDPENPACGVPAEIEIKDEDVS